MASNRKKTVDELDAAIDRGEPVSDHFTSRGKRGPFEASRRTGKGGKDVQKVNVDFSTEVLADLDAVAELLNISRQAVIKTYVLQCLDHHHLAQNARGRKKDAS